MCCGWTAGCSGDNLIGFGLIDSHTHLDMCEPPAAELVAAARVAGVSRLVTVGTDSESCRAALAAAEEFQGVYAAIGRHPNEAAGFDHAVLEELRELAAHEKCVAIGETGLDYYRDYAPRADQRRAFEAQIDLARESQKPLVIHTRAADDDTLTVLAAHIEQHIVDEERTVLPFVEQALDAGELQTVGERMSETIAEMENEDWLGSAEAWRSGAAPSAAG